MRIVDLEAGRQIVGDDDAAELRLRFGDFQHHDDARVLLDLRRIDRVAVERIVLPLDLKAVLRRALPASPARR